MDCRKYKDTIDSFLCGETLVESNLEMIRHAEHCPTCRAELAARRNLRLQMQRVIGERKMSADAYQRLRSRLRQEAGLSSPPITEPAASWLTRFASLFNGRTPLLAALTVLLLLGMSWWLTRSQQAPSVQAAVLSPAVFDQAAREHDLCARFYANSPEPQAMAAAAVEYDAAYAKLDQIAKVKAQGMQMRAAHKCSLVGRNFAHLLFSRGSELISFMVTERDAAAMRDGIIPQDDGRLAALQHAQSAGCTTSAYQTQRHVVFVISKLTQAQSEQLALQVALPISEHVRQAEQVTAR
jgi:hypothetical protein